MAGGRIGVVGLPFKISCSEPPDPSLPVVSTGISSTRGDFLFLPFLGLLPPLGFLPCCLEAVMVTMSSCSSGVSSGTVTSPVTGGWAIQTP